MGTTSNVCGAVLLATFLASVARGNPQLSVTFEGVSAGGNNQWLVAVAPDPTYFDNTTSGWGSSLAVELAFAIEGSTFVASSIAVNGIDWPYDNPGTNPFTMSFTAGVWLSAPLDKAFSSFGSNVFANGDAVPVFSFETAGSELTTVLYGVAASGDPEDGSVIAQSGQNFPAGLVAGGSFELPSGFVGGAGSVDPIFRFTGYTGSVSSVPEPSSVLLALSISAVALLFRKCV